MQYLVRQKIDASDAEGAEDGRGSGSHAYFTPASFTLKSLPKCSDQELQPPSELRSGPQIDPLQGATLHVTLGL